ncbi:glutamic-type intramembrane protease PrsW [Bacillus horti]|uniref:Protease PrsW n=1 Tax=Caldalkalibacillus horti TaxID=77523 RepID=A0ABT9W5K2_9BACI|nr:glutamic-type intramembrane protease PrsW [Bacillus horti]MDQ0168524.1 RsiW-degrading membrane proteinase PrsW (M82 family) [Bacillus horti]
MATTILMAAIAPGLALLSFFYLKDRFDHEPIRLVLRVFIFGALLVFPIMVVQYTFKETLSLNVFFQAYFNSSLIEEFFKWFVIYFVAYSNLEFDQYYDGIVYSVAVSLGFATMENIFYLYINGVYHALIRAALPVSSHALFGVIMGYYLSKSKFEKDPEKRKRWLLYSLLIPIFLHGTYNYILLIGQDWWLWIMIPFMIGLWVYGLNKVKKAQSKPYMSV